MTSLSNATAYSCADELLSRTSSFCCSCCLFLFNDILLYIVIEALFCSYCWYSSLFSHGWKISKKSLVMRTDRTDVFRHTSSLSAVAVSLLLLSLLLLLLLLSLLSLRLLNLRTEEIRNLLCQLQCFFVSFSFQQQHLVC